jgi:hypothetical protein
LVIVVPRFWGLVFGRNKPRVSDRREAEAAFNDTMCSLAQMSPGKRILVENVGHYSLLPRDGQNYLSGPLDHFFPWEIERFRSHLRAANVSNVAPFVDVAHAALSANLFNRKRQCPAATKDDPRFAWISDEDLDHSEWLRAFDFVDGDMPYLHASDAVVLEEDDVRAADLDEAALNRSIVSEGLEIGTGSLPFDTLPARFGRSGKIVLEVDPGAGETHIHNGAQNRSLARLAEIYRYATPGQ